MSIVARAGEGGGGGEGRPEGHSAIRGHLHAVKAHDDVIRLQVLSCLIGWLDVAHQDALLLLPHLVGGAKGMGLHSLPFHAHHREAGEFAILPAVSIAAKPQFGQSCTALLAAMCA